MNTVKIAAVQMSCPGTVQQNIEKADNFVMEAAKNGARIILLPELFETKYFCQERNYDYYKLASAPEDNAAVQHFKKVCAELKVVIPISFFVRSGNATFNSVAVIDADGSLLGIYRKTHIPDDHY